MYKIIADSSCDLKTDKSRHFESVPMLIYTDDYQYLDDGSKPVSEMLDALEKHVGRSYTSCPGTTAWIDAFDNSDEIYVICITSGLSGTYNSALAAKDTYLETHPNAKVAVFDSFSTGPEMCMAIEKIEEMKANGASFEEISKAIPKYLDRVHLLFTLHSIRNLAQNGRVSKVAASAANILGISILGIASEEGTIQQYGKARGEKKVIQSMINKIKTFSYKGGKIRLSHVENEPLCNKIKEHLLKEFPHLDILIYPATGLVSYYAERKGILLGFECE